MSTRRYVALNLLLFTALTAAMTFPQVLHMRDSVHDDGDPLLNAWTLSWVAHQLPRDPARLFDANIFYPERWTLAYSETLLLPAVAAAPLRWIGAGPILVHNIVLLSGFVLSGVGMACLVRALTGHAAAGVLAGLIFAFLPYRIAHYPHLQLQQTQCLPLAMWAFHRLLTSGRARDGLWLGVFAAGQMLSCVYYGLFLVPYMTIVCGALIVAQRQSDRWRRVSAGLVLAAAIAAIAVLPMARAHVVARNLVGERGRAEVAQSSATWRDYVVAPATNVLYGGPFSRIAEPEHVLFPGFVALALAIAGLLPRKHENTKPESNVVVRPWFRGYSGGTQVAYALGLILAFDLSLGVNGVSYRVLYDYFLPFRSLRSPARMGVMVGFSLAVLAGYGAAWISNRVSRPVLRRAAFAGMAAAILIEYVSTPIPLQPIPREVPQVYADILRDRPEPGVAVVEYPMSPRDDPTYMFYSTFHWHPLINGYSGFFPPSYFTMLEAAEAFPDAAFFDAIKARGVRYLLVHQERMIGTRYVRMIPQLDRRPDLSLISRRSGERYGQHGEISLYRVANAASSP